jgi:ubiquinone/menaquinone biosynthesis C-methylase UbiE
MTDIRKCYDGNPEYEWKRLAKDQFHNLEFQTTVHYLKRYLPKKGFILDAGGGPGRYTIELAKMGYDVVLLDYSPDLLEVARKEIKKAGVTKRVKMIMEGSITNMSIFDDGIFDSVICLGAVLGHVEGEKNRERALSEIKRVTKKGGFVFVSVVGRLRTLMNAPHYFASEVRISPHFKRMVTNGDDYMWHGKYYSHLFLPEELEKMFTKQKLKLIGSIGLEGISARYEGNVNSIKSSDKKFWKNWMWAHYKLCTNPYVVATAEHFIVIGRVK